MKVIAHIALKNIKNYLIDSTGATSLIDFFKSLKINFLNKLFIVEVIFFVLLVAGIIPREAALVFAAILGAYFVFAKVEDSLIFFVRSIPLFVALPITEGFDNFNTWRILSIILFAKWYLTSGIGFSVFKPQRILAVLNPRKTDFAWLNYLIVISILSILPAIDDVLALKRIVYFVNLSLIGIVAYHLIQKNRELLNRIIKNIAIPTIIVIVAGFVQLLSTYLIDIYQFMRLWGENIQCRQFGSQWCTIAVELGNTWFAYYGEQLSLRMFSLFPDSHSFPIFVLLGLPAILAGAFYKFAKDPEKYSTLKSMVRTRTNMHIVLFALGLLAAILSGTRGIWAASIGVLIIAGCVMWWNHKTRVNIFHRNLFKYITGYMSVFFFLFIVAWPIFVSPQFLLSKGDLSLLGGRLRSIIDFGETSNAQRIAIWNATLKSMVEKPILGVGIGNYPVILDQDLFLSRAGSSAHNLYLHIAGELGIAAGIFAIWFLWLLFVRTWQAFIATRDPLAIIFFGASILFVPWTLIYSLTDVAIFDERAFSLFVVVIAIIFAQKSRHMAE